MSGLPWPDPRLFVATLAVALAAASAQAWLDFVSRSAGTDDDVTVLLQALVSLLPG